MSKRLFLAGLVAVAAMGSAVAAIGDPWMPPVDGVRILSAPPAAGSPRDIADRAIFQATRALEGSPRWRIAQRDVENGPLSRYACALGVTLKASDVPILASLFDRAGAGFLVEPVKTHYARARPYADNDAPICQARTAALARSGDYPSGHAANGWLEALLLAELAPDRASEILARGRQAGESRVICGAHSASAVDGGWQAGAAASAVLHGSASFRQQLDLARVELARARATAPKVDPAACAIEAEVLARAYY